MDRQPITSRAFLSIGYDAVNQTLELEMSSLAIYAYKNVPQEVYEEMLRAESAGRYWVEKIRACYECERVSPAPSRKGTPDGELETKLKESLGDKRHGAADTQKAKQVREVKAQVKARAKKNRARA